VGSPAAARLRPGTRTRSRAAYARGRVSSMIRDRVSNLGDERGETAVGHERPGPEVRADVGLGHGSGAPLDEQAPAGRTPSARNELLFHAPRAGASRGRTSHRQTAGARARFLIGDPMLLGGDSARRWITRDRASTGSRLFAPRECVAAARHRLRVSAEARRCAYPPCGSARWRCGPRPPAADQPLPDGV
jgi:hypothetical protein